MPTKITIQVKKLNIHSSMAVDRRQETPETKDCATHSKRRESTWIVVLVPQTQDPTPNTLKYTWQVLQDGRPGEACIQCSAYRREILSIENPAFHQEVSKSVFVQIRFIAEQCSAFQRWVTLLLWIASQINNSIFLGEATDFRDVSTFSKTCRSAGDPLSEDCCSAVKWSSSPRMGCPDQHHSGT